MHDRDPYRSSFLNHPAILGMFKRYEAELENEDFTAHALDAMSIVNEEGDY